MFGTIVAILAKYSRKMTKNLHFVHTLKKSRIRETSNLSTDADRRTDTILERLRDLSKKKK